MQDLVSISCHFGTLYIKALRSRHLDALNPLLNRFAKVMERARSSHRKFSIKKGVPKNFAYYKKTLPQVFSSKICEIFKNIYFEESL